MLTYKINRMFNNTEIVTFKHFKIIYLQPAIGYPAKVWLKE
jgi:hypothetical protein